MTHLQIKALGKLQLQHGGLVVADFPTQRVEELTAFLVLHPNRMHSRLKLIDLFWPDCSEQRGRGRLNTAVWRLRVVLDEVGFNHEDVLLTARSWVSFRSKPSIQPDFEAFEAHERRARQVEDPTIKEHWLRQALSLYQGEFCEGIYADWCLLARERLARLHLRALGQMMHCYFQRSAYEEAVGIGQQILQLDPLREEVHRALMRCYSQLGLYPQAIQQFQTCSQLLQRELHTSPMPATIMLYNQIATDFGLGMSQPNGTNQPLSAEVQEAVSQLQKASKRLNQLLVQP